MPPSLIADQSTAQQLASDNHNCQSHDLNQNQLNDLEPSITRQLPSTGSVP